jgi:hypothetical protein
MSWFEIGCRLTFAFSYELWEEAPWLGMVVTDGNIPGRVHAYELTEAKYSKELDAAVGRWLRTGELSTLKHPASYLLALRFATVGCLLSSFEGVLPPPEDSAIPKLYERFLVDWWRSSGPCYAVGFCCAEHDIEAR